jgi:hypothetical protein
MPMSTQLLAAASHRKSPLMPASRCHPEEPHRQGGLWATGLTKAEAEVVLDWMEAHGNGDCQVSYVAGEGFTVTG